MRKTSLMRLRLATGAICALIGAACSSSTTPDDDGGNNNGNGGGGGQATVILTLIEQTGAESGYEVRYHIADGAVSRAAASPLRPQLLGCFDFDPVCTISVPVGKTINFYAYDGPHGTIAGDLHAGNLPKTPNPLAFEFLFWGAECVGVTASLGDCSLPVTQARTYQATATFATLKQAIVETLGAVSLTYTYTARDRLYLPPQPYVPVPSPPVYSGGINDPVAPKVQAILPIGATLTLTALAQVEHSRFLRWEGPCVAPSGGTSLSCTIQLGAVPPPLVRGVGEYYQCPIGRSTGGTGPNPPPECTKVTR